LKKDIIISLKAVQNDIENNSHTAELISEAKFYKKGDTFYISYKESEITGLKGTMTTIKTCGNTVNIIRFGSVSSNMTFEENTKKEAAYETIYGTIGMSIEANKIKVDIDENGGEIYVEYDIDIEDKKIGHNSFYLKIIG
jgi:uncharacterized beta-barrel protein YwiB (DUF1934 family)